MASSIDEFVAELRRLSVSPRWVEEVADHLRESAARHEAMGLSRKDAESRAIEDFGSPMQLLGGGAMVELEFVGIRVHTPKETDSLKEGETIVARISAKELESADSNPLSPGMPLALLREKEEGRLFPIFIGAAEAHSIYSASSGVTTQRPMTHDLLGNVLRALDDLVVERLVITKMTKGTIYAELQVSHHGSPIVIDCRPSDGIALAVRLEVPIFAGDELIEGFIAA